MIVTLDNKMFKREMDNIIKYSFGFLDGAQRGKKNFLNVLGKETIEVLKEYVDSNARLNPQTLHHVYEWYRTGSPAARLFDFDYTVSNVGLSIKSTFSQSTSIQNGSRVPFYNKARIMEDGIPVTIRPKKAEALRFEIDGEEIFTKSPIIVRNPGGQTRNGFEHVFDTFMSKYFKQSFLKNSGILDHIQNPVAYKKNLNAGKQTGRSKGIETGYRWISNIKVGV